MASNQEQGKGNSSGNGKRVKADWNEKNYDIFVKACVEQVRAGNRPNGHFSREGWANLIKNFNERTGFSYNQKQLKNKWDILKKEWKLWAKLIGNETGLGWDHTKQTIAASEEWWAAKIKECPEVAQFKEKGLRNLLEMEILFKDIVATGFGAYAPYEDLEQEQGRVEANDGIDTPMTEEHDVEDVGVQGEEITGPSSQRPKRKRSRKDNKSGNVGHRMCDQFERVIESFNKSDSVPPLVDCLDMLKNLPGLEYGSETHILAVRLMKSKTNRETFVLLNDHVVQLAWIKSHTMADVPR